MNCQMLVFNKIISDQKFFTNVNFISIKPILWLKRQTMGQNYQCQVHTGIYIRVNILC